MPDPKATFEKYDGDFLKFEQKERERTLLDLKATFEKCDGDFLKFEQVENKLHSRPDICAFLLLDKLCPSGRNMVGGAEHEEIFLSVDCDKLAAVAAEGDILTLCRCGVRYDGNWLVMGV